MQLLYFPALSVKTNRYVAVINGRDAPATGVVAGPGAANPRLPGVKCRA